MSLYFNLIYENDFPIWEGWEVRLSAAPRFHIPITLRWFDLNEHLNNNRTPELRDVTC